MPPRFSPKRGLFLFLSDRCLKCGGITPITGFSPQSGIGFILPANAACLFQPVDKFQSPIGDCFYFYVAISLAVGYVVWFGFQSPFGDCFYFYLRPRRSREPSSHCFSPQSGIVFISTNRSADCQGRMRWVSVPNRGLFSFLPGDTVHPGPPQGPGGDVSVPNRGLFLFLQGHDRRHRNVTTDRVSVPNRGLFISY